MGKAKWTEEVIKSFVEEQGYSFLEFVNFKGINSRVLIQCPNGHEPYEVGFKGFKEGARCNECKKEMMRSKFAFTYEQVKEEFEKEGYKLLSTEYKNANTPLLVQCPCGHKPYEVTLGNFKSGHRCAVCSQCAKYDYKQVKDYIEKEGYTLASKEYTGANDCNLIVICEKGHEFKTSFSKFLQGVRCPKCHESKGEKEITRVLTKYAIDFKPQYKYDELLGVGGRCLSYDFYVPNYNLLIEFQGQFHDGSANQQTEEEFNVQKEHDRRKREYAQNKGIDLLEIWYWDIKNIENIIKDYLKI